MNVYAVIETVNGWSTFLSCWREEWEAKNAVDARLCQVWNTIVWKDDGLHFIPDRPSERLREVRLYAKNYDIKHAVQPVSSLSLPQGNRS